MFEMFFYCRGTIIAVRQNHTGMYDVLSGVSTNPYTIDFLDHNVVIATLSDREDAVDVVQNHIRELEHQWEVAT